MTVADSEPPFPAMSPTDVDELAEEEVEMQNQWKQEGADALEDGEFELALEKFTAAISLGHATALMYSRRAQILLRLQRPRAAINDCSAALDINPDSGKAFKIRARAHVLLEQWAEAHSDFQEGLKIDYDEVAYEESQAAEAKVKEMQAAEAPASGPVAVPVGQIWEIVGGADKGGVLVREGLELNSAQSASRLATGTMVEELELRGERLHFRRITGSGPDEGWISIALKDKVLACRVASDAGNLDQAELQAGPEEPPFPAMSPPDVVELSEEDQDKQSLAKQQASEALEDGNQELALEKFTEAIAFGCASALMYSRRAQLLLQLGRPRAAINDCKAALEINPDSGKAFKIRARAQVKLKRWTEAHSDFQMGLKIDYDEDTYEESLAVAAKAKEMQAVATEMRIKSEHAVEQRKLRAQQEAQAAAVAAAKAKAAAEAAKPKWPVTEHGDGIKKCLHCGFKATEERAKQTHCAIAGHAGFYDAKGRLPQYVVIGPKGGG
mmetsp:Transcript_128694/g.223162  ORF Transcript_128694/g.223162 Transcript_128694/m.223162 type:complete len:498 (-) Transcript_128694:37-1530(-)